MEPEPTCAAERILFGVLDQAVLNDIAMHIGEPGKIAARKGKGFVPISVPDHSSLRAIQAIHRVSRRTMNALHESLQVCILWSVRDEVIVVQKDGPGLKSPLLLKTEL